MKYRKIIKEEVDRLLHNLDGNCGLLERQLGTPSKSKLEAVGDLVIEVRATRRFIKANNRNALKNLSDETLERLIVNLEERNSRMETHIAEKHAFRFVPAFDSYMANVKRNASNLTPVAGQIMFNDSDSTVNVFNGFDWVTITPK